MFQRVLRGVQFCLLLAAMSGAMSEISLAQSLVLDLPRQSQRAQVSQRIGITDITISYHRPLVNDRFLQRKETGGSRSLSLQLRFFKP